MPKQKITISRPVDAHVHLREGDLLNRVIDFTTRVCSYAVVMPNLIPPVLVANDVVSYREEILRHCRSPQTRGFQPLMTIKLIQRTTPAMVHEAFEAGAVIVKAYLVGATTNSWDGIRNFKAMDAVFAEMEQQGMVLSIHGEQPETDMQTSVHAFLPTFKDIASSFPKLRIVLEHLTTAEEVALIERLPDNVIGTITAHHPYLTFADVMVDGQLAPYNYCKPVAGTIDDQKALRAAMTSGNPKFAFGSDSAPHWSKDKLSAKPRPGIYTAPIAVPLITGLFEEMDAFQHLEMFTSGAAASFYGLPSERGEITLVKTPGRILSSYFGIVPFMAGQKLSWRVA